MEVATTERHWNDTSVPERPELEVAFLPLCISLDSWSFFSGICLILWLGRETARLQNVYTSQFFSFHVSQGWLHDDALWQVTCSMIIFNMQVSSKQCQFVFHTLSNTVLVDANTTNTFLSSRTQATLGSGILVLVSKTHLKHTNWNL